METQEEKQSERKTGKEEREKKRSELVEISKWIFCPLEQMMNLNYA